MQRKTRQLIERSPTEPKAVFGYAREPFAIHRTGDRHCRWRVLHVPSGLHLTFHGGFARLETAERFCSRIAALADWWEVDPDSPPPALGDQVFRTWTEMRNAEPPPPEWCA